jgi:hypothetical protein
MDPRSRPTPPATGPPDDGGQLRVVPLVLAGIAGDPELSLAAKGVLLVALSHPTDRPVTRSELLAHGHEARWQVGAALAELVETRWLVPIGEGRFTLREDLDDPDPDPGPGPGPGGAR